MNINSGDDREISPDALVSYERRLIIEKEKTV